MSLSSANKQRWSRNPIKCGWALSTGMGSIQQLLLSDVWLDQNKKRRPTILPTKGCRTCENYQPSWKRLRPGSCKRESAIRQTSLDWPPVWIRRQRFLLVWRLVSDLQELGSKWTQWKCRRAMRQHVDRTKTCCPYQSIRILEWRALFNKQACPQRVGL